MPFFLLIVGIIILVAAYRNKQSDLYDIVKEEFFGENNFVIWSLAVLLVGAVGAIKQIKPISDAMLVLIILVIIVKNYRDNQDILTMFVNEIRKGTDSTPEVLSSVSGFDFEDAGKAVLKKGGDILKGIGFK